MQKKGLPTLENSLLPITPQRVGLRSWLTSTYLKLLNSQNQMNHAILDEPITLEEIRKASTTKIPASACRKKKIAYSTNVTESLWEKKGKKYPAHQIARKRKLLMNRKQRPPPPPPQELNGRPLIKPPGLFIVSCQR